MDIIRTLLLIALCAIAPAAHATTIELDVNGLVCAFCAQGIEKTLKALPATADVWVSLEHRLVAVALKDGQDIPDDVLRAALTEAGYTVVGVRRSDATLPAVRARLQDAADD